MTSSSAGAAPAADGLARQASVAVVARLRTSGAVRAVFAARCASGCDVAVVHARRRDDEGCARATVVAGKAVGNAVTRNRVKRRLRAAVADNGLPAGADYVVVARAAALTADARHLRKAVDRCARAALARCP